MEILTIALGLLPGFAWLFFYLQEEIHPEPKWLIFFTFVAGAAAAILAFLAELFLNGVLGDAGIIPLSFASLLILGFVEELFKFGAAYFSVHKNPAFDAPVDAMIYAIVAALGFATVENLGAITGSYSGAALITDIFQVATFRFIGATLLHALTSGIVGYYWAKSMRGRGRGNLILGGLLIASLLHAAFNYLILSYGYVTYPIILLVITGFFVLNDFEKLKRDVV